MDQRTTTTAVVKRRRRNVQPPQWADVRGMLDKRIKDVAEDMDVPVARLRHLCHENGFPRWPGKRIRYMKSCGRNLMLELDAQEGSSSWAELAGKLSKIMDTKKNEKDGDKPTTHKPVANPPPKELVETKKKEKDDEKPTTHKPVANPPPKELVTLNLIDKLEVGSSSGSSSKRN